jgi:hypothetical protein
MYRCSGTVQFHAAVEAESLAEAERIIDGILRAADEVVIQEDGGISQGGDELIAAIGSSSRGRVVVEN